MFSNVGNCSNAYQSNSCALGSRSSALETKAAQAKQAPSFGAHLEQAFSQAGSHDDDVKSMMQSWSALRAQR
jgi:hypothetical protein